MKRIIISFLLICWPAFQFVSAQNPRNVLIEDLTSTMCGWCPCMDSMITNYLEPLHPSIICLLYHSSFSAYYSKNTDTLVSHLKFPFSPTVRIDRDGSYAGYQGIVDSVNNRYLTAPEANVRIQMVGKTYDPINRNTDFSVDFTPTTPGMNGVFMVNALLIEDQIVGYQQHEPCCPGGMEYPHNDVVRKMAYYPIADTLKTGLWSAQETISRNFTLTVDSGWVAGNCELVVYVYQEADSLFKSEIQQAIRQSLTGNIGIEPTLEKRAGISRIYPNPAQDIVNIHVRVEERGIAAFSLLDLSGKEIRKKNTLRVDPGIYNVELTVHDLPSGEYLFHMLLNNKVFVQTILVSH